MSTSCIIAYLALSMVITRQCDLGYSLHCCTISMWLPSCLQEKESRLAVLKEQMEVEISAEQTRLRKAKEADIA